MLITFSGIVGSGKSTSAKYVRDLLEAQQLDPVYLRFRFLSWRKMMVGGGNKKPASEAKKQTAPQRPRALRNQKPASLTFALFAGYVARMLNFRLFRHVKLRDRIAICDRYFYDNLVHYRLESRVELLYFRILCKVMPRPDLGLMTTAAPEIIIRRRGHYEPNYIYRLHEKYQRISEVFCDLRLVKTDDTEQATDVLASLLRERLNGYQKG